MYLLEEVFWVGIGSFQKRDKIQTITNRCEEKKKKKHVTIDIEIQNYEKNAFIYTNKFQLLDAKANSPWKYKLFKNEN